MLKTKLLAACAFSALALGTAMPASAQAVLPQDDQAEASSPDIVVTGSLIRGAREDGAIPIDVIGADELSRQGSPSGLDLLKNLPTSNGIIGDANQFDARAQGSEGVASVNLRGLGPQRTLVLLNGKRIVSAGTGVPVVDINLIPQGSIGRIEILKDGAAATYGSDAIAGVVNFITRSDQEGFQAQGDYRYVRGSSGDYTGTVSYGHTQDGFQMFASFGYQHRSELRTTDRDFTVQPYQNNPQGGFSGGGSPGNFGFGGTPNFVRDLGCEALGGFRSLPGSTTDRCFTNFGQFDNLVEPEDRYQAYIETKIDLASNVSFKATALYGSSSTRITTSPSYLPTLPPSANAASGGAGLFIIPTYAPALRDYCSLFGAASGCVTVAGQPVAPAIAFPVLFRPFMLGGNPLFTQPGNDRNSAFSQRQSQSVRFTAEFDWEISSDLNLDTGFTYSEYERGIEGTDTFGDLFQNALAGFGGPNCAFATPASRAGLNATQIAALAGTGGCNFFNPFSTAVLRNPVTGQTNSNFAGTRNPTGFNLAPGAGLINDLATIDNFFRDTRSDTTTRLFVGDIVLSGQSGIELPGGPLSFAIGGQYRSNSFRVRQAADNNLAINPCPGSPLNPAATCNPQTGALGFLGTNFNRSANSGVYAVFGELQAPVTDTLNLQFSARFENYGGQIGSTFNPQGRARWQVTPWLAIRGGAGTTFRGPPAESQLGQVTSLQVIGTSFRAIDIRGNPNLEPETALTYGGGIVLNAGPFSGSIDYFRYDLNGPAEAEPVSGIVNALFGASGTANCANPAFAALRSRFTFTGAGCGIGNVQRLTTNIVNSADVSTSGIDFQGQVKFDVSTIKMLLGVNGTYIINYKTQDITVEGVVVQPAFDGVGQLNFQTSAYPLPQIKGNVFLQADVGRHNVRLQYNYIDGYTDQRGAAIFGPNPGALAGASVTGGKNIGAFDTLDFTYRVNLPTNTVITLSAQNILNKQPPFARLDFNYDPFTASPLGFNARFGITQRF
ncbi:TonB-dependent receptor domain-containing protein [Sphingomonas sp. 32-62-10]|nr:MAG: hypothetical protein B7Z43_09355 [Sphingomonas sp. 12-62-6]OYX40769.1 MAG: hypothetical protein B7Y98_00320 [Sphingomonas sp. 32-62-10]